jgi:CspA family cold shock protein
MPETRHGRVAAYDERRGLGEVEAADGTRLPFHCTAIADGTRRIAPGTAVAFDVVAGPLGRTEADAVRVDAAAGTQG